MTPLLEQFISEAREMLEGIAAQLLQLESRADDADLMNELFRLVHTLKGNSGLFDFPEMTRVLHAAEDLMDRVRMGAVAYSHELADCLLDTVDFLSRLVASIADDGSLPPAPQGETAALTNRLRALMGHADGAGDSGANGRISGGGGTDALTGAAMALADLPAAAQAAAQTADQPLLWVDYTPAAGCFFQGEDPLHTVRQIPGMVWCRIAPRQPLPALAALDPYDCALGFAVLTTAPRDVIEPMFRYAAEHVVIADIAAPAVAAIAAPPADMLPPARAEDAASASRSLKVDQTKIERLMNLIGEMIVSKNALPYLAQKAESGTTGRELSREIKAHHAVINRITEEMQDAIMQIRMMPVAFVFQRFPRLVRDLSRKLDKQVELVLEGEATEADKSVIESLADPLIHIVRNSLDHGLETVAERRAAGKADKGRLLIRAAQEGDRIIIDITDDGRGIDPVMIRRKALEKGVIDPATADRLSDREAVNLVFAAGFSTAAAISDLSGRGVGMDVVRSAVERVNGTIMLDSEAGKGTRIRITLPLSMAVTRVMVVESDKQLFALPMEAVVETVRLPRKAIHGIKTSQTALLRNRVVPLRPLNDLLGLGAAPAANDDDELAVLVSRLGDQLVGLVVDDFHETLDVIQKPLPGVLGDLGAYSGSTLLGDGSVLMVLNPRQML